MWRLLERSWEEHEWPWWAQVTWGCILCSEVRHHGAQGGQTPGETYTKAYPGHTSSPIPPGRQKAGPT